GTLRRERFAHEFTATLRLCVHRISPRLFQKRGSNEAGVLKVVFAVSLLVIAVVTASAADDESKTKNSAVTHPNLLLNRTEIEQIKRKVLEYPWAAGLLERVRAKAKKDDGTIEAALAYVLTRQTNYAVSVRKRLLAEVRDQMRHYEKIDVH